MTTHRSSLGLGAALLAALLASPLSLSSAQAQPARPAQGSAANAQDPVLVRVNNGVIRRSDFQRVVQSLPAEQQKLPPDQLYNAILPSLVENMLILQAAERAKLQDQPAVRAQIQAARDRILTDSYARSVLAGKVTEDRVRQLYDERLRAFRPQEELRARHILVATEQEAYQVIQRLAQGADFVQLVRQLSKDPTNAQTGGDLGFFNRAQVIGGEAAATAIFALQNGDFTRTPIQSQNGWHIVRVEERRMSTAPTYEKARPALAQELTNALLRENVQELGRAAKIEQFDLEGRPVAQPARR